MGRHLSLINTVLLYKAHKDAIYRLWNNEYPAQLLFTDMTHLEAYFEGLMNKQHYFVMEDSGNILAWAVTFDRDDEKWFAIIVDGKEQGHGLGGFLLKMIKRNEKTLNGWMTDHDRYVKQNGEPYRSPVSFYAKHDFIVHDTIRLETEKLSAAKITWQQEYPHSKLPKSNP